MQTVEIRTADRRDRQRHTLRLIPLDRFHGMPIPGEPVLMRHAGVFQPVPAVVHFVHYGDGLAGVEPDFQSIRAH